MCRHPSLGSGIWCKSDVRNSRLSFLSRLDFACNSNFFSSLFSNLLPRFGPEFYSRTWNFPFHSLKLQFQPFLSSASLTTHSLVQLLAPTAKRVRVLARSVAESDQLSICFCRAANAGERMTSSSLFFLSRAISSPDIIEHQLVPCYRVFTRKHIHMCSYSGPGNHPSIASAVFLRLPRPVQPSSVLSFRLLVQPLPPFSFVILSL